MSQRSNHEFLRDHFLRVQVALALNIVRETPPHLTPRSYTTNLLAVLRPMLSVYTTEPPTVATLSSKSSPSATVEDGRHQASHEPKWQQQQATHSSLGNTAPSPSQAEVERNVAYRVNTNRPHLVATADSTACSFITRNILGHQPQDRKPNVLISVKPIQKLIDPVEDVDERVDSQSNSVELLEDVPQDVSKQGDTRVTEGISCGNRSEHIRDQRSVIVQDTVTPVTIQNMLPRTDIPVSMDGKGKGSSDWMTLSGRALDLAIHDGRVVSPDSTCRTVTAEDGGREDLASSPPHLRQQQTGTFCTFRPNIMYVPSSLPAGYIRPSGIPPSSLPECLTAADYPGTQGVRVSSFETFHDPTSSSSDSSHRDLGRDPLTGQVNTNVDHSRRISNITEDSTTGRNNTDEGFSTRNGRNVMVRDADVFMRNRHTSGNSRRRNDNTPDSSSNRNVRDAPVSGQTGDDGVAPAEDQQGDPSRICRLSLEEVMQELHSGLRGAYHGAAHDWNKCYHSINVVRGALRRADSRCGRFVEGLCVSFLEAVLATLASATPIHPPSLWWCVIEASVRALVVVSTWPPLLVRAGNVILEVLVDVCHKVCTWLSGDCEARHEQLAEVAYALAGALRTIVNQACYTLGKTPPTTAAGVAITALDSSPSSPVKEKSSIDAALEALSSAMDIYTTIPRWIDPAEDLYLVQTAGRDASHVAAPTDRMVRTDGQSQSREGAIKAALALLAPQPRHEYADQDIPSTRGSLAEAPPRKTAPTLNPPEAAALEWNLLYWRSVIKDECTLLSEVLPMFVFQVAEIIQIIDHCCD
ncbi:uncharacterized protein [Panulirus ornatus]|uniref:uncharacterized protein isoform X2 n=1 Tax=Panulirus ornatus TaxID=150431 RepID=UPI003A87B957